MFFDATTLGDVLAWCINSKTSQQLSSHGERLSSYNISFWLNFWWNCRESGLLSNSNMQMELKNISFKYFHVPNLKKNGIVKIINNVFSHAQKFKKHLLFVSLLIQGISTLFHNWKFIWALYMESGYLINGNLGEDITMVLKPQVSTWMSMWYYGTHIKNYC